MIKSKLPEVPKPLRGIESHALQRTNGTLHMKILLQQRDTPCRQEKSTDDEPRPSLHVVNAMHKSSLTHKQGRRGQYVPKAPSTAKRQREKNILEASSRL